MYGFMFRCELLYMCWVWLLCVYCRLGFVLVLYLKLMLLWVKCMVLV